MSECADAEGVHTTGTQGDGARDRRRGGRVVRGNDQRRRTAQSERAARGNRGIAGAADVVEDQSDQRVVADHGQGGGAVQRDRVARSDLASVGVHCDHATCDGDTAIGNDHTAANQIHRALVDDGAACVGVVSGQVQNSRSRFDELHGVA